MMMRHGGDVMCDDLRDEWMATAAAAAAAGSAKGESEQRLLRLSADGCGLPVSIE